MITDVTGTEGLVKCVGYSCRCYTGLQATHTLIGTNALCNLHLSISLRVLVGPPMSCIIQSFVLEANAYVAVRQQPLHARDVGTGMIKYTAAWDVFAASEQRLMQRISAPLCTQTSRGLLQLAYHETCMSTTHRWCIQVVIFVENSVASCLK